MDTDPIYSFGYWVRRRRMALDLTQRELAERVGCALVTLKKIESDSRRPSLQMAGRLAEALQIPTAEYDLFITTARGERPVDTLGPPPEPVFHRSLDSLPRPATPLIGREAELRTLLTLLDQPATRLATIAGPGGIGKTRLALAAGEHLSRRDPHPFPQGIVFVDLAAAATASDLVNALSAALGFEPRDAGRSDLRQLADYLRDRRSLLILDNIEQIAGVSQAVDELLRHTTAVHFLATSRERLNLSGEHLLALPGLPCPAGDAPDPDSYPAGALFLSRARRVRSGFVARETEWGSLANVCRLVDGLPLALELAASWVDTLSPGEIAIELQRDLGLLSSEMVDLPARHRSLDTVWASTWARLAPETQTIFARLSIFRGGFTRAAAEAVAGASLASLAALTGRYMITLERDSGRYRIHELLRQYGLAELGASVAAAETRQRHFDYYETSLAAELTKLRGPEQLAALARLDAEQDNIRLALRWGLESAALADRLAAMIYNLHWYWRMRSRVREGQDWAARALVRPAPSTEAQAALLFVAGHMNWMAGDFAAAHRQQSQSLELLEATGEGRTAFGDRLEAFVYMALGMTEFHQGNMSAALAAKERALALFQMQGDEWGTAFILGQLGRVYQRLGDADAARATGDEALARGGQLGDSFLLAIFYSNAAYIALENGDTERAAELARRAGAHQRATGHVHSLGQTLLMLGRFAREQGDETAARAYFAGALAVFEDMGNTLFAAEALALLKEESTP